MFLKKTYLKESDKLSNITIIKVILLLFSSRQINFIVEENKQTARSNRRCVKFPQEIGTQAGGHDFARFHYAGRKNEL